MVKPFFNTIKSKVFAKPSKAIGKNEYESIILIVLNSKEIIFVPLCKIEGPVFSWGNRLFKMNRIIKTPS